MLLLGSGLLYEMNCYLVKILQYTYCLNSRASFSINVPTEVLVLAVILVMFCSYHRSILAVALAELIGSWSSLVYCTFWYMLTKLLAVNPHGGRAKDIRQKTVHR